MANEVAVVNKFDIVTGYEDMDAELLEELQDEMEDLDEVKGIWNKGELVKATINITFAEYA